MALPMTTRSGAGADFLAETIFPGDAEILEQRGSGRIDAGVGAGDVVAAFGEHAGERRHGGSADADQVMNRVHR